MRFLDVGEAWDDGFIEFFVISGLAYTTYCLDRVMFVLLGLIPVMGKLGVENKSTVLKRIAVLDQVPSGLFQSEEVYVSSQYCRDYDGSMYVCAAFRVNEQDEHCTSHKYLV